MVYVISYIPWAMIEGHQLWPGVPPGHTGQTLIDLTRQMYDYHNSLSSPHPASSPWWAWPFDLKPVWFYQDSFANETTAAIYDAGNLVIWWLGVPAMIFAALMAYRRRSLALALITIGFATQWIPWARIDRPAFQYHYYTALPFVIMALAYLVAELWHGPSRRTWMVVRLAAAAAIVGPAAMWILSRPLCAFVGVQSVNPGSAACPAVIPDLTVTVRSLGLLVVLVVGAIVLGWAVRRLDLLSAQGEDGLDLDTPGPGRGEVIRTLLVPFVLVAIGFAVVALLPETEVFSLTGVPVEPIAVLVAIPLIYLGAQVIASRDARRFAIGLGLAVSAWFVVWYPNISALPLPSAFVNAYQGLIPTYLYAFQFPVRTGSRTVDAPLFSPTVAVLGLAITVTCLVVAYSAWIWRLALAESRAPRADPRWLATRRRRVGRPGSDRRGRLRDVGAESGRQVAPGREAADHEPVVVVDLGRHARPAERLGALAPGGAHLGAQRGVVQQALDGGGQLARLPRRHEQALASAAHDALVAVDIGGHDRRPGGHGLEEDDPERLAAGRRRGKDVRRLEELGLLGIADAPQEFDALQAPGRDVAPGLALLRPAADDQEARLRAGLAQDAVRLQQVEDALARLVAPDEQHVRRPVLPAGERDRVGEAGDVDAVGDDLVVAREEPVDEVAGRRADRDPSVQPAGVALQRPAAELVRRREAGVGVEGRDVDRLRLAQQEERQERHERLVEVEDIEPLALEHRADLAEVARREGQGPDRGVDGHREPDTEADDVAFGGALRAVAGGQDADVVAAQPEVLVEESDVLRHAAVGRIDVGADQADLHDCSSDEAAWASAVAAPGGPLVPAFPAAPPGWAWADGS